MSSQFLYKLTLIQALLDEKNWTDRENEIVSRHFSYLQKLMQEGILILAGRTLQMDEQTFGIVIFKANSSEEAKNIMENDPAVIEGIMNAHLFPYRVALISEENSK